MLLKRDDKWCNAIGAAVGGAAAATSLAEAPSSIFGFVAFGYIADTMLAGPTAAGGGGADDGDKVKWRGRSAAEIRAEAESKARKRYAERHAGDATRLRALK